MRVHAKPLYERLQIVPYSSVKKDFNKLKHKASIKLGEALFLARQNTILEQIRTENQWMNIREGIKLRNVVTSKRMNEVTTYMGDIDMEGSFLAKTLVINRNLGLKHILPGSGQWQVHNDKKSECWKCGQHILTIFLWTPRVGKLTCERDPQKETYYKNKLDSVRDTDEFLPMNASSTPLFAADFNNWKYEKMHDVVRFCMQKDLDPPNFVQMCINEEKIKNVRPEKLLPEQEKIVHEYAETYYKSHW